MKAAILKAFGTPLAIESMPDPVPGTGEVVVDIVATPVLSYSNEVFSGERRYVLDLPAVPGCGAIGRIRSFGPDATHLTTGDWVFCDPTVRSRDDALSPDIMLLGWSARGAGGQRLQQYFRHGTFAEQAMMPTENAVRIGALNEAAAPAWCALNTLLVPYGGLLAAKFQPGEILLVSGATGHFGSACVQIALAMGAGCVIAPGRNEAALADLARRFGSRVRTVRLTGDEEADREGMRRAAPGPIDCVLDIMPPSVAAAPVRTALMTVRPYGRAVLMGGVGMLGGAALELPYPWIMRNNITIYGQWMYAPDATTRLAALIRAGMLDLSHFDVTTFGLDQANDAVAHAAAHGGPFRLTVMRP